MVEFLTTTRHPLVQARTLKREIDRLSVDQLAAILKRRDRNAYRRGKEDLIRQGYRRPPSRANRLERLISDLRKLLGL